MVDSDLSVVEQFIGGKLVNILTLIWSHLVSNLTKNSPPYFSE